MTTMNELFAAGGKPKRTLITTGTGTFVPSVDNALCRVRVQAAGSGGYTSVVGGGGGAMVEFWIRVPITGLPYVVGAAGGVGVAGGLSSFGPITANPGTAPGGASAPGRGGVLGMLLGSVSATTVTVAFGGALDGLSGGQGADSAATAGYQPGFPFGADGSNTFTASPMFQQSPRNGMGGGSGGDSFHGKGGTSGNAPAATAYGAGGGINAAGRGGCIDIEDFGA